MAAPTQPNGMLLVIVVAYFVVFWPTFAYQIYGDSVYRGLPYPRIRGVLLGFLGFIGLFIHRRLADRGR